LKKVASEGIVLKKVASEGIVLKKKPKESVPRDEKQEEEAAAARRKKALLAARKNEESESSSEEGGGGDGAFFGAGSEDSSSSGSDSDSDSDSDSSSSEYEAAVPMLRPVFVSKSARETVKDGAQLDAEFEEEERKKAAEEKARVKASKKLVVERIEEAKSAAAAQKKLQEEVISVDVDDVDETEEYEQWKVRELMRMKREREERLVWSNQKAEVERRRRMDDDEILAEDGDRSKSEKAQLKFLQRYYHKGAFYQDELKDQYGDEDFSAATGADADIPDKSLLPAIMQVRSKWALRGRTKYTHLADQDTTYAGGLGSDKRFGELPEEFKERMEKKRGGLGDVAMPSEKSKKPKFSE
jgi:microfibrillar-associated protein 1